MHGKACGDVNSLQNTTWAATWQNQQNGMRAQQTQSDPPSLIRAFAVWVAKDPSFLHVDSEDWSLIIMSRCPVWWSESLLGTQSFCWFCHEVAHVYFAWRALSQIACVYSCNKIKKASCRNEPTHDKINKMTCAPSEDSDQPGHPPSLIRVFAVRLMGS